MMNLQRLYPIIPFGAIKAADRLLPMSAISKKLHRWLLPNPASVKIHITCRCNYDCIYCYSRKDLADMSLERIRKIIDFVSARGIGTVELTGGEPLLHKDIFPILKLLRSKGMNCTIYTNGSLINEEMIDFFSSYGRSMIVSVKYESLKNYGRYTKRQELQKRIERNISVLSRKRIKTVGFITLSGQTFNLLKYNINRVSSLGAYPALERYVPVKGKRTDDLLEISIEQWEKALSLIRQAYIDHLPVIDLISRIQGTLCSCYRSQISIMQDGDVLPCQFAPKSLVMGNIWSEDMEDIFNKADSMTADIPAGCRSCNHAEICRGGCRTHAYLKNGDLNGKDPLCSLDGDATIGLAAFALLHIYDKLKIQKI